MALSRRAALQLFGLAALPSLARAGTSSRAWEASVHARASATPPALFRADERALVSAVADALLPRTDTPGALDVGVPAFVELIVAEWMTDDERSAFREGLLALDAHAVESELRAWPALDAAAQGREVAWAEGPDDRALPAKRAFSRLKGLVVQGYFSSERVQREVVRTVITPGRYFGCAPIPSPGGGDA